MEVYCFDDSVPKFLKSLQKSTIAKILRNIGLLIKFEHNLKLPHSSRLSNNFFELRMYGKQEIRIFYTFTSENIILLSGFIKKSQKIPKKEIDIARRKLNQIDKT